MQHLLAGLTEFAAIGLGSLPESDKNYRVGVYDRDPYDAKSFRGSGFLPQFVKPAEPNSNRVRHAVAYMAAGFFAPTFLARRALHNAEGTSDLANGDVALGEAAISLGANYSGGDYRQLAQDVWHKLCGGRGNLNLP